VHLGWSSPYGAEGEPEYDLVKRPENHIRTIRFLDLIVGLVTLPLDNAPGSKQRREKYGKAGCFRPTPYGVEYRTPSCWWLASSPTTSLVLGLARTAWNLLVWGLDDEFRKLTETPDGDIRAIVDEGDTKESYKVWKRIRPYLAVTGTVSNPLHVSAIYSKMDVRWKYNYNSLISPLHGKAGAGVSALAAFEYAIKNGIGVLADPDPIVEWNKTSYGFTAGSYVKLIDNPDFHKFQTEFLEKTMLEV
jgi:hypothetical protein